MTITLHDIDGEESWAVGRMLPLGVHDVTIAEVAQSNTSNNNPQIEMKFANKEGDYIRDWLVVVPNTYGKVLQLLEAVGIEPQPGDWDFDPGTLFEKRLQIRVGEEPDREDPTQMRSRVFAYMALGTVTQTGGDVPADTTGLVGATSGSSDDDIPF